MTGSSRARFGRVAASAIAALLAMGCDVSAGANPLFQTAQYRGDYNRNDSYRDDSCRNDTYRNDSYRNDSNRNDYNRNDRRGGGGGSAPQGSYLQSCGNVQVRGSTLTATCRGNRGRPFETSLDLTRCGRSDIGNNGGTLECAGSRGRSSRAE